MWSIIAGFLGGIIAWFATAFVGEPIRTLLKLRQDASQVIVQYEHRHWIGNPEAKPPESAWLDERRKAYDVLGTQILAFAASNVTLTRLLHHNWLGKRRLYLNSSGEALRTLAEAYPGLQAADDLKRQALSGLKIPRCPEGVL